MQVLDFSEKPLVSRLHAADDLREVREQITSGTEFIVHLGRNLATTSWVDGFLVPLARTLGLATGLAIVAESDVTRSHLQRVFASRGIRARVSRTREEALRGAFELIPAA